MRAIKWIIVVLLALVVTFCAYLYLGRSFYTLPNGKCVTVWKKPGPYAYIIPERYWGLTPPGPGTSHIRLHRFTTAVDLIWLDDTQSWLLSNESLFECEIHTVPGQPAISRCRDRECDDAKNLIDPTDDGKYRAGVQNIQIYVKDGYARVRNGSTIL